MTRGGEKKRGQPGSAHTFSSIWNFLTGFQKFDAGGGEGILVQGDWGARELLATYRVKERPSSPRRRRKTRMPIFWRPRSFLPARSLFRKRSDSRANIIQLVAVIDGVCTSGVFVQSRFANTASGRGDRVPAGHAPGPHPVRQFLPVAVMRWTIDLLPTPRSGGISYCNSPNVAASL